MSAARVGAVATAPGPRFSAFYVSNWSRLPRPGRFWRAMLFEASLRRVFNRTHNNAVLGRL